MERSPLPVLLWIIVAVGAAGVYLLLRDPISERSRNLRRTGGALAGVAFLLLVSLFGMEWRSIGGRPRG
jgi:hypothetical protein